ncbi:YoaK family protein [Streptococcus sp. HF-1907]|uniref:YoaK family protein n=1 Tax=Streptococcus sp. HF-1907 TaxID=2785793 RepID=UPI001E28E9B0|nr:YoaK family protein [Streptococcus sp. HF-1907]
MTQLNFMPQNSRFSACLLGFMGGALDVYCHIHFESLVATQTGNILLLVADWKTSTAEANSLRLLSILFFSVGFLIAIWFKNRATTAFWRSYTILPLLLTSFLVPLLPKISYLWVTLLALSTGMITLTFTGSQIESHAYTILMTSGNYRKMLSAWYQYLIDQSKDPKVKRQAVNYSIVVGSFVIGAISVPTLEGFLHEKTLWLVTLVLALVLYHYTSIVIRYHLQKTNI